MKEKSKGELLGGRPVKPSSRPFHYVFEYCACVVKCVADGEEYGVVDKAEGDFIGVRGYGD
jgi:hypothetical protein